MTSEDYLESLLKQAEETDDPNSARSRIREINRREALEKADTEPEVEEPAIEEAAADESMAEENAAETVTENPTLSIEEMLEQAESSDYSNDADLKNLLESIDKELETTDSEVASSLLDVEKMSEEMHEEVEQENLTHDTDDLIKMLDDLNLNEAISDAKENIADSISNSEITDSDVNIEDLLKMAESADMPKNAENTDISENDESLKNSDFTEDDVKILDSDVSGELPVENPVDEIENLLKTDFSGEVEVEDIDKLLAAAEDFANNSNEAESPESSTDGEITDNSGTEGGKEESENSIDSDLQDLLKLESEKQEAVEADGALALDQDELEKLLNQANAQPEPETNEEGEMEIDLNNLDSLESLGIFDKNELGGSESDSTGLSGEAAEGLDEIAKLLNTVDSNEPASEEDLEMLNLLENTISEQKAEEEQAFSDEIFKEQPIEEESAKESRKDKKSKKNKSKKAESQEDANPGKASKTNPFKKLFEFLTAEEEEPEDNVDLLIATDSPAYGSVDVNAEGASGENKEILEDIDSEGEEKGKGKKKKKKKGKKGENKPASEDSEDGEEKEAPKKPKKEKKERKPLVLDIDTGKPLSKKNVRLIFVLAASLLLCIIAAASIIPKVITNSYARKAYYSGDYETVYTTFFGQELSENDQLLYDRAEIILKVSHKCMAYSAYSRMGMKVEALDQLLQAVDKYETWLFVAESVGCTEAFRAEYSKVLVALYEDFGIDESAAKAVNALPTDLEYSLMCESIANRTEYINPNNPLPEPFVAPTVEPKVEYQDVLPEEEQ